MSEERFVGCSGFCRGGFHTTACEAERGILRPHTSPGYRKRLPDLIRPYLFEAVGSGVVGDQEALNSAATQLYQDAVCAQYLKPDQPSVQSEIQAIRKRIAESRASQNPARRQESKV